MIIVNLTGGLGNQMFQYALGRALSQMNNDVLKLDTENLSRATEIGNIYRSFSLSDFMIIDSLATKQEINEFKYPYGLFSKLSILVKRKILRQFNVVFDQKILKLAGHQYLDGYWQSPKYFENIRETLLNDFQLKEPLPESGKILEVEVVSNNSIAIHVRRGDYINNSRVLDEYGACSISYYQKAITEVIKTNPDGCFYIFSDDIDWAKSNLSIADKPVVFVEEKSLSDSQELYLMSKCKHNIIANSSFSWWSAWLNQNPNKIVIAPTPWFDKVPYDENLIPASWKQLPK